MMNRLNTFLIITLVLISGCASHGRNILLYYEDAEVATEALQEKMQWIEPVVAEGKPHEQFRIVQSLRYTTRHNPDPIRRRMAVNDLVFITAFATDANVRDSAWSRLITLLNDPDEDFELKAHIIAGQQAIVTGERYYRKAHVSLFSAVIDYENRYAKTSYRRKTLKSMTDHFIDLPETLQPVMVDAFRRILENPVVCLKPTPDGCESDDGEAQEAWKKDLGDRITHWLHLSCPWTDTERIAPSARKALHELADDFPEYIEDSPTLSCPPFNPAREDTVVLEQRSLAIPGRHFQIGIDLTDAVSDKPRFSQIEFGWGNRANFGFLIGIKIDDRWMQPLREQYLNFQYRNQNRKTAIGITRYFRLTDITLVDRPAGQPLGSRDGESIYVNTTDENELYLTSVFDVPSLATHVHLYLGSITQSVAVQYFFRDPDLSFVAEGYIRQEPAVEDRETDTPANQDKAERREQALAMRQDLMIGAKWNNLDFLKRLFVGEFRREARQGIINARIYYSLQRQKLLMGLTHPF